MDKICKLKDIYIALYTFEKTFAEQNGITINEAMLLCCLKDGKAKAASQLCEFVGLSHSRVSRIISSVENKQYIVRAMGHTDKRQMIFSLSHLGLMKIKEMQQKNMEFDILIEKIRQLTK